MRKALVYRNGIVTGILTETDQREYIFTYDDTYFFNTDLPAISLTMPKDKQEYRSSTLFPFFFNMLSEGVNKKLQSRQFKIDEEDYFGLLLMTAQTDTIGAISIKPEKI